MIVPLGLADHPKHGMRHPSRVGQKCFFFHRAHHTLPDFHIHSTMNCTSDIILLRHCHPSSPPLAPSPKPIPIRLHSLDKRNTTGICLTLNSAINKHPGLVRRSCAPQLSKHACAQQLVLSLLHPNLFYVMEARRPSSHLAGACSSTNCTPQLTKPNGRIAC